jgi:hypothetical protein
VSGTCIGSRWIDTSAGSAQGRSAPMTGSTMIPGQAPSVTVLPVGVRFHVAPVASATHW